MEKIKKFIKNFFIAASNYFIGDLIAIIITVILGIISLITGINLIK